jgi:hypothetical protein
LRSPFSFIDEESLSVLNSALSRICSKQYPARLPHSYKHREKMRFFIIVFGGIVAASAVNASPLALTLSPEAVAGSVLTNRGVTYEMSQLNEMKPFDQKVDDGHYPRPVTYQVHAGYTCTFYT